MEMLFIGGPLDGQYLDVDLPLTETVGYIGDGTFDKRDRYDPDVRPYFLHTVLSDVGPVPMYATTPDWNVFAAQLTEKTITAQLPGPDPADLPPPAERTTELTVWIPRE